MALVQIDSYGQVVAIYTTTQAGLVGLTTISDADPRIAAFQAGAPSVAATLASKLAAGLVLTCTGNSALNGTYALDQTTQDQISGLVTNGFPHGNTTQSYPFMNGPATSAFTVTQMTALRNAMRDHVFDLQTQAGVMAAGSSPTWPSNAVTIA